MAGQGPIVVVKVGGSLLEWPALPQRLAKFLERRQTSSMRLVLIAGGGRAADWIRDLDRIHQIGEERSHELAVRSLDLTAYALQTLIVNSLVVRSIDELTNAWESGRIPILALREILIEDEQTAHDPLPRSWDNTTDSLAARMAKLLGAERLVLLKSTNVVAETRQLAADQGVVDPLFPEASRAIPSVKVINLREDACNEIELKP